MKRGLVLVTVGIVFAIGAITLCFAVTFEARGVKCGTVVATAVPPDDLAARACNETRRNAWAVVLTLGTIAAILTTAGIISARRHRPKRYIEVVG